MCIRDRFYDYDEVCPLTDCNFRRIPPPRNDEEEMSGTPWYSVAENDVFPEEFRLFFSGNPQARAAFEAQHADLYDYRYWQRLQDAIRSGHIFDTYPYRRRFRFPREEDWRLWTLLAWLAVLAAASGFVYGRAVFRRSPLRRGLTLLWLLTPVLSFVLLVGLGGEGSFLPRLNPDIAWGGLLLTLIIAVFGILASFPLGLVLALGRRSRVQGVPAWLVWAASLALLAWLLVTQSLPGLRAATTTGGRIVALWPLLLLPAALLITRAFRGNLVALLSTAYIEVIRGVPLITILFMSIIIFPFLLPPGMEILGTWRVMAAVALFSAAYLAENVRGGLQSIPRGQYLSLIHISEPTRPY